tara:strand:- start:560 stop:829 length:270 start_codon:yes stop_codon:yes gene_type:complete
MSVSRQDYVSTIRGCYPGQKISLTTLIETIISKYGKDNSMTETMLDNILNILLGEGKDMAFAVHNEPTFSRKLKFHFDTQLGQGFFTTK